MLLRYTEIVTPWKRVAAKVDAVEDGEHLTWQSCLDFSKKMISFHCEPPYHDKFNLILLDLENIPADMAAFIKMCAFKLTNNAVGVKRKDQGGYLIYTTAGYNTSFSCSYHLGDILPSDGWDKQN